MIATNENQKDRLYICGIKPISLVQTDPETNLSHEINLMDYYPQAWRTYYPRLKILPSYQNNQVILYEEATNEFLKIDFEAKKVSKLEKELKLDNYKITSQLMNKAKKTLNKFYSDSNRTFKTINLDTSEPAKPIFLNYGTNGSQISFINFNNNDEINMDLSSIVASNNTNFKLGISHIAQLSEDSVIITGFDTTVVSNIDNLSPEDLKYFILKFPADWNDMGDFHSIIQKFKLSMVEGDLLGSKKDLLLAQSQLKNFKQVNPDEENSNVNGVFKVIIKEKISLYSLDTKSFLN